MLEIRNLHAKVADNEILRGIDLTVNAGEVHVIMGPNGSGKSTLAQVLAGREDYEGFCRKKPKTVFLRAVSLRFFSTPFSATAPKSGFCDRTHGRPWLSIIPKKRSTRWWQRSIRSRRYLADVRLARALSRADHRP
jgi:energy-coupling factor transporter ATP-binding protein EcfA2